MKKSCFASINCEKHLTKRFMVIASVLIAIFGFRPTAVLEGIGNAVARDLSGTLRWFVPLLFTGLACAVAFKAGVWNMGVDGQLYMGAIAATTVALKCAFLPAGLLWPLTVLAGMAAGALWALIAGWLRVACGAKEVVTTILMNYLAFYFTDFMVLGPLKGTGTYSVAQSSDLIQESLWLPRVIPDSSVSAGLWIGLALIAVMCFLVAKTPFGYEIKLLGTNRAFANYGGINIKRSFLRTIAVSGAIAGLCGVVEILGVHHRFPFRFSSNLGFDGIVVSILANDNPIGVLFSGFFFAVLRNGSYNIERMSDVPRSLVLVVQATIIILAGAKYFFSRRKGAGWFRPIQNKKLTAAGGEPGGAHVGNH